MSSISRLCFAALAFCLALQTAAAQDSSNVRPLAEGVLTVIPPRVQESETFTGPVPMVEIVEGKPDLQWKPNFSPESATLFAMAKQVTFRRDVWCLQFAFKPMRMIYVDIPQPDGSTSRKLIWYLVYRVQYTGGDLQPKGEKNAWGKQVYENIDRVNYQYRRFLPHFVLECREYDKSYLERIIPAAKLPILQREFPGKLPGTTSLTPDQLHNTVEIMKRPIRLSSDRTDYPVWGIATWEGVDPRIDYYSLFIKGLTNAYTFKDPPGAFKPGDPPGTGRTYSFKTLQLNFWRPGDTADEHEGEVRFGLPLLDDAELEKRMLGMYGLGKRLDYLWVYR